MHAVSGGSIVQANSVAVDAENRNRGAASAPRTTGAMTGERIPLVYGRRTRGAPVAAIGSGTIPRPVGLMEKDGSPGRPVTSRSARASGDRGERPLEDA